MSLVSHRFLINKKTIAFSTLFALLFSCSSVSNNPESKADVKSKDSSFGEQKDPTHQTPGIEIVDDRFSVQDLFKKENSDVVNAIAEENFASAVKKAEQYLSDTKRVLSETQRANLKYMHIYAFAGLVIQKKRSHHDLNTLLDTYKDQYLITQHLEITKGNQMPFNQIRVEQEKKQTIEVTCANDAGVNIHCFVHVKMKEDFDLTKHIGKQGYLCGKLSQYKLSGNDVFSWIADLDLKEGSIKILEDEFAKQK